MYRGFSSERNTHTNIIFLIFLSHFFSFFLIFFSFFSHLRNRRGSWPFNEMEPETVLTNGPLSREGHPAAWKFGLMFLVVLTPGFAALNPALHHEFWPLLLAFVIIPIIDYLVGVDVTNPASEKEEKRMSSLWRYRIWLLMWVPLAVLIMMAVLPMCSLYYSRFSLYMTCFAVIAMGLANG